MVILDDGTRWCSGSLVNNAEEDYTLYFLTAFHCGDLNAPFGTISTVDINDIESWIFMFNYESPTCSNIDGPTFHTISGATYRSIRSTSDFLLVELSSIPPPNYYSYFAGWSRSSSTPSNTIGIHHPSGDIKKISFDDDPPTSINYLETTSGTSHWRFIDWDLGTTEGGSSGSPLFDQNHRIIGQLHGGYAACGNNSSDWYGKFSVSWNGGGTSSTRLKDWLDPNNTGATTMNGMYGPVEAHIDGLTVVSPGSYGSFTAETKSGNSPFTYKWYKATNPFFGPWSLVSSSSSYGQTVNSAFYLKLAVTDSKLSMDEDIEYISTSGCSGCPEPKLVPTFETEQPENFELHQNYPNPFNPSTNISFELPESNFVSLIVYDLLGREVQSLILGEMETGIHKINWNASFYPSGIYIATLRVGSLERTIQMLLQK